MKKIFCTVIFISIILSTWAFSDNITHYYISINGDDNNPGTIDKPFKSISKGLSKIDDGVHINIMKGIYYETLEIKKGGSEKYPAVVKNYLNDEVIIDGSKSIVNDDTSILELENISNIEISGLTIRNLTSYSESVPSGIFITGNSHNIRIINNNIYAIKNLSEASMRNAHGIAVYGNSKHTIKKLSILRNKVHSNILGSSEAVAINGNVQDFHITENEVFDNDNIGIDIIGYEGVCDVEKLDEPRYGKITGNSVYNNRTDNNPSYYGDKSCAGIYIDGATFNLIEDNKVYNNNFGIEIGVENLGHDVYGNTVSGNSIYYNDIAGLLIGGYQEKLGYGRENKILGNTIYHNQIKSKDGGEIILHKSMKNIFMNNKVIKNDDGKHIEYWIDEKYVKENIFSNNQWK